MESHLCVPQGLRAELAAVHWGRCTRFALPHASSITRETPGVVARILPMSESKVLRRPAANYAPMLRSCNGSRQHFLDCCVHATPIEAIDGFRRRNRCGSLRLRPRPRSNSPSGERGFNGRLRRGGVRPSSRPVTSRAAATPHSMARLFLIPCDPDQALGSGRCPARLRRPARLAFRAAKLSINAEKSGFGTTTR
jgi:hypothetical protein